MSLSWKVALLAILAAGTLGVETGQARNCKPYATRYYYYVPTTSGGIYYYPIHTAANGERYYYPSERFYYVPPTASDDVYVPAREDRQRAWRPGDPMPGFTHTNE